MSDLTRFRDHCRAMASGKRQSVIPMTIEDCKLWLALADEIDRWLATGWLTEPEVDTAPLWEEA